jgi:hypothetical protein
MSQGPKDSALMPIVGLALLKKMGKFPRRKKSRAAPVQVQAAAPSSSSRFSGIALVTSLLKTLAYMALLLIYLIVEVFVAMLAYAYLHLYHVDIFGQLVGLSANFLTSMARQIETFSPELANQAYATLLGEFAPKSILLLFIGLGASMLIRFMVWVMHLALTGFRSPKAAASSAQEA